MHRGARRRNNNCYVTRGSWLAASEHHDTCSCSMPPGMSRAAAACLLLCLSCVFCLCAASSRSATTLSHRVRRYSDYSYPSSPDYSYPLFRLSSSSVHGIFGTREYLGAHGHGTGTVRRRGDVEGRCVCGGARPDTRAREGRHNHACAGPSRAAVMRASLQSMMPAAMWACHAAPRGTVRCPVRLCVRVSLS